MVLTRTLCLVAVASACASSFAIGGFSVSGGIFYPSSRTVRDAFGSQWNSFGLSFGGVTTPSGMVMGPDFNVLFREKGSNSLFIGTLSYGVTQSYGQPGNSDFKPYLALRVSGSYADYRIVGSPTIDRSKFILGWNAEAGVVISDRFQISARYDQFQRTDGLRFDGLSLNAQFQVVKF